MIATRQQVEVQDDTADLPRWIFLHALRTTLGRTPVWITAAAIVALLALAPALTTFAWFDGALQHHYEPGSLLRALDESFRVDHRESLGVLNANNGALGSALALLAMLVGAFMAGGWLQVFLEHTEGHSLLRFFYGGARYFFRFLRVLVVSLLILQLLGWVLYGTPWNWLVLDKLCGVPDGDLQGFNSELTARRVGFVQDGLFALGFATVLAWGDYTRTRLAAHGTHSAVWAGLCSWTVLFAHPIRTLRPLFFLWLGEAAIVGLAGLFDDRVEADLGPLSTKWTLLAMFTLGIGVLLWRTITRGARYAACARVTRELVRPLSRPDPWKRSVGGPGGPRYPIDGDEYGVSL
jgi:hypothetical protein